MRTRIFTMIVIGLLLGNVFIAISQTTEASEIKNGTPVINSPISDVNVAEVMGVDDNSPINRRLTIYEEKSISPVLVSGDDDVLHMAWIDSRSMQPNATIHTNTIFYKQSYDYGNTWTSDTPISIRNAEATSIDMAIDDDYLAIAWEEGNNVFTMFSYDNGYSWTEPYQINSVKSPSIALKGNDVYLVFKNRPQVGDPYLSGKKLTINPELQTPVVYDFNPAGNNQICSIGDVTADDNSVHVVIKDQTNTQLHYYKSDDNGTTWSGGVIGDSFGEDVLGSVKIANKDNLINIVWSDNRDGNYNLYMKSSNDYGQTWNPDVKLMETSGKSTNIDVAFNSESEINICWEEISDTGNQIFYGKFDKNSNEISIIPITDCSSTSSKPSIAVDSDDYFYTLWQDDRDDNDEIYFSTNLGEFDKQIDSIIKFIYTMPDEYFSQKAEQQKNTLNNKLEAVRTQLEQEAYTGALNKLENDVLKKIDTWIIDITAQEELTNMISGLITSIELYTSSTEPIGGSECVDIGTTMDTLVQPGGGLRRHPYEWSIIQKEGSRTFRLGDKYSNFLLDIVNQNWAKNIDYRITFVFMASAEIEVKQLSGASWQDYESIGKLPGNGNWRTFSLETNYQWNYDYSTANTNCNILFEFESIILLDSISVIPVEYNCDVGESNDNSLVSHEPGVCLYPNSEWQSHSDYHSESCKVGQFSSSGNGPNILANLPNSNQEYRLTIRYNILADTVTLGDIYLQLYKGTWPYSDIGKLMTGSGWKTSTFIIEKGDYYDFLSGGMVNLLFQFGFSPAKYSNIGDLILIDSINLTAARDYCDFGTAGDGIATDHEPGVSRYLNSEWGPITWINGKSCRLGNAWSNFYLNDIDTSKDYVIRITYKSNPGNNGYLRQYDGSNYHTLGEYTADGLWHTSTFIAKAFWFFDYNGANSTYAMNALFEFSKSLYVDEISVGVMEKYAIICSGGSPTDTYYPAFRNDLKETHDKLIRYGWQEENVYTYCWDKPAGDFVGLDGPCSNTNIVNAFADVGNVITTDDFFFFMVISHGHNDDASTKFTFGPESPWQMVHINQEGTKYLMGPEYAGQIGSKPVRSVWLIHCCFTGNEPFEALGSIPGSIVISATQDRNETTATQWPWSHWGFFKTPVYNGFALNMGSYYSPHSVGHAFDKGQYAANHNGQFSSYHPRMLSYWCDAYITYW